MKHVSTPNIQLLYRCFMNAYAIPVLYSISEYASQFHQYLLCSVDQETWKSVRKEIWPKLIPTLRECVVSLNVVSNRPTHDHCPLVTSIELSMYLTLYHIKWTKYMHMNGLDAFAITSWCVCTEYVFLKRCLVHVTDKPTHLYSTAYFRKT